MTLETKFFNKKLICPLEDLKAKSHWLQRSVVNYFRDVGWCKVSRVPCDQEGGAKVDPTYTYTVSQICLSISQSELIHKLKSQSPSWFNFLENFTTKYQLSRHAKYKYVGLSVMVETMQYYQSSPIYAMSFGMQKLTLKTFYRSLIHFCCMSLVVRGCGTSSCSWCHTFAFSAQRRKLLGLILVLVLHTHTDTNPTSSSFGRFGKTLLCCSLFTVHGSYIRCKPSLRWV